MARPAKAGLNLGALRHNVSIARSLAPDTRLMAVVKANAYGHGSIAMAQTLEPLVDALAVACSEEALELRAAGVTCPILLMEGVFEAHELITAAQHGLWVTIDNDTQLRWLEETRLPAPLDCWLKIDTGMHRLGVLPEQFQDFHQRLLASGKLRAPPVLSTHFASADELDNPQTARQLALFESTCSGFEGLRSAANSPAVLAWPQSHYDWIRPGYMLWGNSPFAEPQPQAAGLQPVMTLSSAVISVRSVGVGERVGYGGSWQAQRPSRVATVTIGYGDGYPRTASSGTPVLIDGRRAPLVGRVSMDMITVDITDLPPVAIGAPAILWGEGLPVTEVACTTGTSGYELLTRMPSRTPRIITTT
ncbi:alanine racemase [Kineobactrum sediminis]|uniref:Alanine racemase n=1 Tax=Kineobactrum sediminis TaxID=1905677 RepID=A0A2N5Y3V7_9GAMM|nr:alanine racemase [Kineobactrum sediminis]PLW83076.1 alanine racemase [Kineobactrum sediminis]